MLQISDRPSTMIRTVEDVGSDADLIDDLMSRLVTMDSRVRGNDERISKLGFRMDTSEHPGHQADSASLTRDGRC